MTVNANQRTAIHRIKLTGGHCRIVHATAQPLINKGLIERLPKLIAIKPPPAFALTAKGKVWIKSNG